MQLADILRVLRPGEGCSATSKHKHDEQDALTVHLGDLPDGFIRGRLPMLAPEAPSGEQKFLVGVRHHPLSFSFGQQLEWVSLEFRSREPQAK